MATHSSTAPARAGERGRSLKSQIGPVTAAIRTMRKAEQIDDAVQALAILRQHNPEIDSIPALRDLRSALADRIEADIALLDALDGDADIEQDAGEMPEGVCPRGTEDDEPDVDDEPSLCGLTVRGPDFQNPNVYLDGEMDGGDMRERDDDFEHDGRNLPAVVVRYGAPAGCL